MKSSIKTVGSTKIFKAIGNKVSQQSFESTIDADGFLIIAVDPIVCYKDARFEQHQTFRLNSHGNAIILDWYSSGREASFHHILIY